MSEQLSTVPGILGEAESSGTAPLSAGDDEFGRTMVLDTAAVDDPEPDEVLQPGSLLRDRYLIRERVAGGSMGVVYKAIDRHLDDAQGGEAAVAIKVLSPQLAGSADALRALQQEAAKGRYLSHPNIVRFIDLDREGRLYFLIMEWLDGQSLAEALDSTTFHPDMARSLDILQQIAEALAHAHRCGVVHADVKPGNIMLMPDGSAKLVDFGIARVRQKGDRPGNTPAALQAATPAYSSMQVLTGDEPTPADDVFSLACLAYRLFAGHRVFGPRNAAEAAEAGMEPQPPPGLAASQWKALRKGLAFSRVARQQSPLELVQGLRAEGSAAVADAPAADAQETVPYQHSQPIDDSLRIPREAIIERRFETRTSRWPWVLLLLLVGGAASLAWRPDWRNASIEFLQQKLAELQQLSAVPGTVPPAPASGDAAAPPSAAEPTTVLPEPATDEPPAAAEVETPVQDDLPVAETVETSPESQPASVALPEPDGDGEAAADDAPVAAEAAGTVAGDPGLTTSDEPEPVDAPVRSGTASLVLAAPGEEPPALALQLREDGEPITIELFRWFGLGEPLLVRVDEIGFTGSRSPGEDGQYVLSDGGVISFEAGQRTASLTISARADDTREADMQADLLLRDYYSAPAELARIDLRLLDDDQRRFEAGLPVNAVAFATTRSFVRERDPAAQIDVVRFNPDQSSLSVSYNVVDETATEGEDYFAPSRRFVTFGPGQRNARILIPLVQDSRAEGDESFAIELNESSAGSVTLQRITVMIRDDDTVEQ